MFVSREIFKPSLIFAINPVFNLNQLSDIPTNIRFGSKAIQWTNTLAYFNGPSVTKVKKFYNFVFPKKKIL